MNLPTQAQISAATRHLASVAGGAILMFGLQSKMDPETVRQFIEQTGALVNNVVLLLGIVLPALAAWKASSTASPVNQIGAVSALALSATAPLSREAKVALLDATASQPEVVGAIRVSDPGIVASTVSPQVLTA